MPNKLNYSLDEEVGNKIFYDNDSIKHILTKKLGEGGQGAVYRTKDKNIAIKLLIDKSGRPITDINTYKAFSESIDNIRILPLTKLNIAKPTSLLQSPYCGYTLRLLEDMIPIKELIKPNSENLAKFYIESGGLKKRLLVLAKASEILARIHAKSIAYADISQNNIFISESIDNFEVWLIDCDNLRFISDKATRIYTPGFGAPEVVKALSGNTVLSDIYSFAILAYYTLVQAHPFLGEMVENAGGWDQSNSENDDMENKAYSGDLPWVGDESDNENYSEKGIPRDKILTKSILNLFKKTFEEGRNDKTQRPGLSIWSENFRKAADLTLKCKNCSSTYYANLDKCPFCNEDRPGFILINVRRYDPETEELFGNKTIWAKSINLDEDDFIYNYHVRPSIFREDIEKVFELKHTKNGLKIEQKDSNSYYLYDKIGNFKKIDNTLILEKNDQAIIICGDENSNCRYLTIKYYRATNEN